MPPRFQSLAFSLLFGSDRKPTNFKLFSLTTAEVFTLTKANYEKKPKQQQTKPKPNKTKNEEENFLIFQGSHKEDALCRITE